MNSKNEFNKFVSNTFAATNNNYILKFDNSKTITGRIYYKICEFGCFDYKLLFSNAVDSTFTNGEVTSANMFGGQWQIISAYIGDGGDNPSNINNDSLSPLLFNGKKDKNVLPGEMFWSDEISISIEENHYLVFEWTVSGNNIPFTPDKIIPSFIKQDNKYIKSADFPQPNLIACNRNVQKRIAFLGDSITQGLGTRENLYEFWVAKIGKQLGNQYSVWNIGLGYGRAQDAATNGIWLFKAVQMDIVSICFGVNDILQGRSKTELCRNLLTIVTLLKNRGITVCIFTVPPFDWESENKITWENVNKYIKNELSKYVDFVFDTVPILGQTHPNEYKSKYGSHPDGNGGTALAESFIASTKNLFSIK